MCENARLKDLVYFKGAFTHKNALKTCQIDGLKSALAFDGLKSALAFDGLKPTFTYKKRPGSSGALDACKQTFVQRGECLGASHLLGLEAAGAHVHLAAHTVHDDVHALDVRTELTVGDAVGVADGATGNGVLTADFANFGHVSDPS